MKLKLSALFLLLMLFLPYVTNLMTLIAAENVKNSTDLYFGVDVAFENLDETIKIIDEVSSYTNLFIIGCYGNLSYGKTSRPIYNETRLNFLSQYVFEKNMSFIVYSDDPRYPSQEWINKSIANFGNKFLGIYYYDEPGGKQLDQANYPAFYYAENFSDAANRYVNTVNWWLRSGSFSIGANIGDETQIQLFTSDYGLYWFDYEAGYDTVFAEYGWNTGWADYSRQLNAALVRGAATAMDKDWGIMITWAYQDPPYMESGPEMYYDMVSAYVNGAKYIIIFDSNENWTENVLQQDHFDAMKEFWQYTQNNPRAEIPVNSRTAYVLPEDLGEGFRSPDDSIWGLWYSDYNVEGGSQNYTDLIKMSIAAFLGIYGPELDIIYPFSDRAIESIGYEDIIFWNDPGLNPYSSTFPSQRPAGNESAWQLSTPIPSKPTLEGQNPVFTYIIGVSILSIIVVAIVGILLLRKRP